MTTAKIMFIFIPYLAVHCYTDVKTLKTDNKFNVIALLALLFFSRHDLSPLITALLYCLVAGLALERMGVWLPGDTRMFAICGGYMALLGVLPGLYACVTLLGYAVVGMLLLAANRQLGMPNPAAIAEPLLRDKGVRFPGAPLITAASAVSLGVMAWKF